MTERTLFPTARSNKPASTASGLMIYEPLLWPALRNKSLFTYPALQRVPPAKSNQNYDIYLGRKKYSKWHLAEKQTLAKEATAEKAANNGAVKVAQLERANIRLRGRPATLSYPDCNTFYGGKNITLEDLRHLIYVTRCGIRALFPNAGLKLTLYRGVRGEKTS